MLYFRAVAWMSSVFLALVHCARYLASVPCLPFLSPCPFTLQLSEARSKCRLRSPIIQSSADGSV